MRRTIALVRASEAAERSAARLAQSGYASVIAPATQIRATQAVVPRGGFDAVVATSAKAFDLLSASSRDAIVGLPLFVVGERSAEAAAAHGLEVCEAAAPDGAALAQRLRARLAPASRVLYLAGRDRTSELELALAEVGRHIAPIEVYAAEARVAWRPEEAQAVAGCDAALHYSRRSAELALRLAEDAGIGDLFRALLHVCISEQAGSPLRTGAPRIRSASAPNEDALFEALARAFEGEEGGPTDQGPQ